jgi:putative ABC transport system permease protein
VTFRELTPLDTLLAATLLAYAFALSWSGGLGLGRTLAWGAARAFVQLSLLGLALEAVISARSAWVVLLVLLGMSLLAADGARRRVRRAMPRARLICFAGIAGAALGVLPLVIFVVLRPDPWFAPHHVVPVGGLLIGSTMTGTALALDRLLGEAEARRAQIEAALALGATPREAARGATAEAIQAAMIAPINHLMIVGLIQIPGVTTGLLLADQDPQLGVRYQLVISYAIVSSVAITATITARLATRELFTPRGQLRLEVLERTA